MRQFFADKRTREKCHIYAMLDLYAKKRHISFHTPGHKIGKWDITELSFSDNLSCPNGCIAQAERDIAQLLGANKSFILTDGSTCGVFAMLHVAKATGVKKIYVIEPVHISVYNACAVLGLTPLSTLNGADAILCTSPDYYGNIADFQALKETGKLLLVDGAHGGHLHFDKELYAGTYADLWVDGVHKSLPALTQGAVVSAKTETLAEKLQEAVKIFRTTSPSYPVMASVEYAVKYPKNERLESLVRAYANDRVRVNGDYTKLLTLFGKNAFKAQKYLEERGVYAEFCDGNAVCFYLSPATKLRDFKKLKKLLKVAFERYPYEPIKETQRNPAPLVFEEKGTEWVALTASENRVCAANCGLFPPCTPLIKKGERITQEKIALLNQANNVFGLNDRKILVYEEENVER